MSMSLDDIQLCACGRMPMPETHRPDGRVNDLHRLSCACGLAAPRWSLCQASAIRFWNSIMTTGEAIPDEEHARKAG